MATLALVLASCIALLIISVVAAYYSLNALIFIVIAGGWLTTKSMFYRTLVIFLSSVFFPIILFPIATFLLYPDIRKLPVSDSWVTLIYWMITFLPVVVYAVPAILLFYFWYIREWLRGH